MGCLLNMGTWTDEPFDSGLNYRKNLQADSSSRPYQEKWCDKDKGDSSIKT